jgi:hypothetical protein
MASTDLPLDSSAQPVVLVGATTGGVTTTPAAVDASGNQQVVVNNTSANPVPVTFTSAGVADVTASGTITASGQSVTITVGTGQSEWALNISGTFSAGSNIIFEGSENGTDWFGLNGRQTGVVATVLVNNINGGSAPYLFRGNLAGMQQFRARCTSFQSGDSIAVGLRASTGIGAVFLNASIPAGTNTIGTVARPASYTTGNITALNGTVSLTLLEGQNAWEVYLLGTFSAGSTVQFQGSLDGTNWFLLNGRRSGTAVTNDSTTNLATDVAGGIASNWRGNIAAIRYFRVICIAFQAGDNIAVQMSTSTATGATFLNAAIPAGTNIIGGVTIGSLQNLINGIQASVFPAGQLRVQEEPTQLMSDQFPGTFDTINKWFAPVTSGGGYSNVASPGAALIGTGTTANGYSYIRTQPSFRSVQPGWMKAYSGVNLEHPITLNTYRFWGWGLPQATPTAASPLSDAAGFEVATNGKMYAVCYSAGARNVIADLSASTGNGTQPTDAAVHKYFVFFTPDLSYWCIDTIDNLVATMPTGAPGPIQNVLPYINLAVAGSTAPTSNGILSNNGMYLADTTSSNISISDGDNPWKKASIKSANQSPTSSDLALVVALSPNSQPTLPSSGSKFSFGQLTTSAKGTFAVEATTYTEQTTNAAMTLVSSSANDTSAGTGARTITVTYLDQSMAGPFTTTFTMNGTTAVTAGVSNMCFIEKIVVATVGSTTSNVGTITLKSGATTVGTIAATANQTYWAHHYTPAGKTSYISGFNMGNTGTTAGNSSTGILFAKDSTSANAPEIQISDFINAAGAANSITRNYNSPIQVQGPARIRVYVTTQSSSTYTQYASFDYIDN